MSLLPDATPATVADLDAYHRNELASFHMPGHKQRGGFHPLAPAYLGEPALRNDVSEMGGYDYLHAAEGSLTAAQKRSAQIFGAHMTFFLVNGSTVGNLAAVMTHAGDGDTVVMLRASHRSVYTAIALGGATPVYVPMRRDETNDGWFMADPPTEVPASTTVIHVTRPNYYGMAVDLAPYRALADRVGAVLVVDEAHGSHFGADPRLPASALQQGADIVIQSTHKTLSALTQSSMLHLGGTLSNNPATGRGNVNVDGLKQSLAMLQSSSPSALLTVSLDLAAEEHARDGYAATRRTVDLAVDTRSRLTQQLRRVRLLDESNFPDAQLQLDPTKLVLDVAAIGFTGFDARAWLKQSAHINVELADHRRIVCSLTVGDDEATAQLLIGSLLALDQQQQPPATNGSGAFDLPEPQLDRTPRLAVQATAEAVTTNTAFGRICAEYLIPYPPGIPLVAPGEVLTAPVLRALQGFVDARARIVGPADPTLRTVRVLA